MVIMRNPPPRGPKQPRGKTLFNKRDVSRAIRSARDAGETGPIAVEITKQGSIRVVLGDAAAKPTA
jgi:hypothetical protein